MADDELNLPGGSFGYGDLSGMQEFDEGEVENANDEESGPGSGVVSEPMIPFHQPFFDPHRPFLSPPFSLYLGSRTQQNNRRSNDSDIVESDLHPPLWFHEKE